MATTWERCKYVFSAAELAEQAQELALKIDEKETKETHKKEVASQLKAEIDSISNDASRLATNLRNGYEYKRIECEIVFDYAASEVRYVRSDNGETARTRPMTADEKQEQLDLGEGEDEGGEGPEGAGEPDPEGAPETPEA